MPALPAAFLLVVLPFQAQEILLVLILGAWAAWAAWTGADGLRPSTPAGWLAWAVVAVHALSTLVVGAGEEAAFRTAVLAALALALGLAPRMELRSVLGILAVLGAWTGLEVLASRLGGIQIPGPRFGHKGLAAAFLAIALPAALLFAVEARGRLQRIGAGVLLALLAGGLVLGETRAAWVAALAAGALTAPFLTNRRRLAWLALGGVLLGGTGLLLSPSRTGPRLLDRLTSIVRNRDPRLELWKASVEAWREKPWLGHGPGSYAEAVSPAAARRLGETHMDSYSSHAHNDLLETGVETGGLGAGLLTALLVLLALSAVRRLRAASAAERPARAAAVGGLLAGVIGLSLCFPLQDTTCALALALLAGQMTQAPVPVSGRAHRILAVGILLALALSLRMPAARALAWTGNPEAAARLAPGVQDLAFAHAGDALALKDGRETLRRLGPARRFHPASGKLWILAGQAGLWHGDPAGAERRFRRGRDLAPWDPDASCGLAMAQFQAGRPRDAYATLARALAAFPAESSWSFHLLWGEMLFKEGLHWEDAESHLQRFLVECPDPAHPRHADAERMEKAAREHMRAPGDPSGQAPGRPAILAGDA